MDPYSRHILSNVNSWQSPHSSFQLPPIKKITHIPDEIVLARIMTALDLEYRKALHYHYDRYESDNDYGLPTWVMRPIYVYSVFTTEAFYKGAQCPISPFTPR